MSFESFESCTTTCCSYVMKRDELGETKQIVANYIYIPVIPVI